MVTDAWTDACFSFLSCALYFLLLVILQIIFRFAFYWCWGFGFDQSGVKGRTGLSPHCRDGFFLASRSWQRCSRLECFVKRLGVICWEDLWLTGTDPSRWKSQVGVPTWSDKREPPINLLFALISLKKQRRAEEREREQQGWAPFPQVQLNSLEL